MKIPNIQDHYKRGYKKGTVNMGPLTADGRTPPRAVQRASLPTGIPIPYRRIQHNISKGPEAKQLKRQSYLSTQISKSQDSPTISDTNNLNIPLRPVPQNLQDPPPGMHLQSVQIQQTDGRELHNYCKFKQIQAHVLVPQADIQTLRLSKDGPILLAGLANSRCVNKREQLLHIIN